MSQKTFPLNLASFDDLSRLCAGLAQAPPGMLDEHLTGDAGAILTAIMSAHEAGRPIMATISPYARNLNQAAPAPNRPETPTPADIRETLNRAGIKHKILEPHNDQT